MTKCVVFIVGTTSGLGKAAADLLAKNGFVVYGTMRNPINNSLYNEVKIDITNEASITEAVKYVIDKEGRIDVLINNAGVGIYGAIEDYSEEDLKYQFDVNVFGNIRLVQAVLPYMRKQKFGKIIVTGSLAGLISVPYQGAYSASKYAIEGFYEALRHEIKHFNISVSIINPGDFKTGFTNARRLIIPESSAYKKQAFKTLKIVENDENIGSSPQYFAQCVLKIINTKNPKNKYFTGLFWQIILVKYRFLLPTWLTDIIMRGHYGIK